MSSDAVLKTVVAVVSILVLVLIASFACLFQTTIEPNVNDEQIDPYIAVGERHCLGCGTIFEVFRRKSDGSKPIAPFIESCANCPMSIEDFEKLIEQIKREEQSERDKLNR